MWSLLTKLNKKEIASYAQFKPNIFKVKIKNTFIVNIYNDLM